MAGAALLAASVPMPAHSLSRDITYGAELLAGIPVALYRVWLIVLSYRLPGHLADRVGSARRSSPRGPGSRASSAASGHMVMRGEGHGMIVSPNAHWCFADLLAVLPAEATP
jgi:hypothetical protein